LLKIIAVFAIVIIKGTVFTTVGISSIVCFIMEGLIFFFPMANKAVLLVVGGVNFDFILAINIAIITFSVVVVPSEEEEAEAVVGVVVVVIPIVIEFFCFFRGSQAIN
jgi:hypothetical protein